MSAAMLCHTFCHLEGVGPTTEQRLWRAGVHSWDDLRDADRVPAARRLGTAALSESRRHFDDGNPAWFDRQLPSAEAWRLFVDFRDHCAYLDIETTGLGPMARITTIALYDGRTIRHYIDGVNLDDFRRDVAAYRLLVTYNGKSFDLPMLQNGLGVRFDQGHIDLRHVLFSLGIKGGMKGCERQLGLSRPDMEEVDGYVAVLLWNEYRRTRNPRALDSLLAYNIQDTVNLETLMIHAWNRKLARLSELPAAAGYRLPLPVVPANPFRVDSALVRRLRVSHPFARAF